MLPPGAGRLIAGGALHAMLKVSGGPGGDGAVCSRSKSPSRPATTSAPTSTPGRRAFYVLEGTLDLLAFEPVERTPEDWHAWISPSGQRYLRGGPGSILFVPAGIPHAFANLSSTPARMFFQAAPAGHEDYFEELAARCARARESPIPRRWPSSDRGTTFTNSRGCEQ